MSLAAAEAQTDLNFDWITPHLGVGGSFPEQAIEALARDHAIAAVIDARAEAVDDERLMARHGIAFLHLPTDDMFAIADTDLDRGVGFASGYLDQGKRVLVHCQHGIGRSALLALCILVARGQAPLDALQQAKTARAKISPSQHQFEGWLAWLARHSVQTGATWALPGFDAFAAIAYRHLRQD